MSKPTTLPIWATDTTLATGSESGLSTKLEPSLGVKQQGCVAGEEAPARWMNWLFNNIYSWVVYLNGLATDAQFLASNFAFTGANTTASDMTYTAPQSRRKHARLTPTGAGAPSDGWFLGALGLVSNTSATSAIIHLEVPAGATLTAAIPCVFQSLSSSGANAIHVGVYLCTEVAASASTRVQQGSTTNHSGSASVYEDVPASFTPFVVGANQWVELVVSPPSATQLSAIDRVVFTYTETVATGSR